MFWLLLCAALIGAYVAWNILGAGVVWIRWNVAQKGGMRTFIPIAGWALLVAAFLLAYHH